MPKKLGPLKIPWPVPAPDDDPYWDFFIKQPAEDHRNLATEIMRRASEGNVFPTKAELHTPEITASHLKELARYLGAQLVGIVDLRRQDPEVAQGYPFAIVAVVQSVYDPRTSPGFGGQAGAKDALYVTYVLSAYIRELGYRATAAVDEAAERLAEVAGLGRLNAEGRLVVPKYGNKVHVSDVIRTDLPMTADG